MLRCFAPAEVFGFNSFPVLYHHKSSACPSISGICVPAEPEQGSGGCRRMEHREPHPMEDGESQARSTEPFHSELSFDTCA